MEAIVLVVFIAIVAAKLASAMDRSVQESASLCSSCSNAFVVIGAGNRKRVYCNYAGSGKEIKYVVSECSGYCNKNYVARVRKIGYLDTSETGVEAFPATVIRIAARSEN